MKNSHCRQGSLWGEDNEEGFQSIFSRCNKKQKAKKPPTLIIKKNKHVISGGKSQSAAEWWVAYSLTE